MYFTLYPQPVSAEALSNHSADMLIYRHLPAEEISTGTAQQLAAPALPKHLVEEMEAYNRELMKERENYEREKGLIDIMAFHPKHFRILGGHIQKRIAARAGESTPNSPGAEHERRDKKLFTLSKETTVAELVKSIVEALGDPSMAALLRWHLYLCS